ncbi:hypothetical protein AMTR_s00082p00071180 [Amborella trichopoda]|uniref:DUF834 domain-containing protein n=1 Tax=Amborella trichopoda TaxID=13333 RepID=W1NVP0_AMBTC|nr:hypothetical protein AMTR_s00082p00071180 [Amborella trichopoda]
MAEMAEVERGGRDRRRWLRWSVAEEKGGDGRVRKVDSRKGVAMVAERWEVGAVVKKIGETEVSTAKGRLGGMRKWLDGVEGEAHGNERWHMVMGAGHDGASEEGGREGAPGEGGCAVMGGS